MRNKSIFIFLVMIFLASCAAPTVTPQTSEVSETSEVLIPTPTSTPAPVMRIVVTPGAPIAELPSSAEIDSSNAALPEWIIGNFEAMGLPDDLEPTTWDSARYASVRQHGLVPVLEGGVVANYRASNDLVYGPVLEQISSEDGTVLFAAGEVQPGGIIEYASLDGKVKRFVRVEITCPEGSDCIPAVRYVGEDAGGLYWLMLDKNTGEITQFSPAVTEEMPGQAEWLLVGDRWSSALSGPTALQAGEGYGIDYQRSVDGTTNILYFAAGDKEYQAKDREIHYTPTDKRLWVENESGIFLFDNTTHEWTRVADQGTEMIGVGDKQMIIAGEAWHTVESIDGSSGAQIVTTQDGEKWVWGEQGWEQYVTPILAALDYDASDHKNYGPEFYTIETREWQGQQVRMLIHDDPSVEGQRIDGMEVMIDGELHWVRGAYYPVEGYGGMAVDVIVHPLQVQRAFFTQEGGAQAVYGELLTAIAHQTGMSEQGLQDYLASHGNKIEISLPQFWNPDNHSKNRSPSYLQASDPVTVDLSLPVVYASRSGTYIDQEVAPGVTVPDGIRWVVGDSKSGIAVFVANEQLFVVFEFDGNITSDRIGNIPSRLLRSFEAIARMKPGFVDTQGEGNSLLEKIGVAAGKNYRDGDLILDRDVFYTTLPDYSDFDFTVFEWK